MYILRLRLFYPVTTATVVCCILMQILCVVSQKKLKLQILYRGSAPGPHWGITPSLLLYPPPINPVRSTPLKQSQKR